MIPVTRAAIQDHHDALTHGMRWGDIHDDGKVSSLASGCFAGAASTLLHGNGKSIYACFHGDGPEISLEELCDPKLYNEKMRQQARPWNKFEGTERSKIWLTYLLG